MNEIRYFTRTGRPSGSEQFVNKMEKRLQRKFMLKSPGKPRKIRIKLKIWDVSIFHNMGCVPIFPYFPQSSYTAMAGIKKSPEYLTED